jgi:hypothetical protein
LDDTATAPCVAATAHIDRQGATHVVDAWPCLGLLLCRGFWGDAWPWLGQLLDPFPETALYHTVSRGRQQAALTPQYGGNTRRGHQWFHVRYPYVVTQLFVHASVSVCSWWLIACAAVARHPLQGTPPVPTAFKLLGLCSLRTHGACALRGLVCHTMLPGTMGSV